MVACAPKGSHGGYLCVTSMCKQLIVHVGVCSLQGHYKRDKNVTMCPSHIIEPSKAFNPDILGGANGKVGQFQCQCSISLNLAHTHQVSWDYHSRQWNIPWLGWWTEITHQLCHKEHGLDGNSNAIFGLLE